MCLSNLKQLGTAFQMYASDNDGFFPAPITNYGASGGRVPPTWVTGDPNNSSAFVDSGGIYPYVKQRGNGGLNNSSRAPTPHPRRPAGRSDTLARPDRTTL